MNCNNKRCREILPESAAFCPSCGRKQVSDGAKKLRRTRGTGSVYKLSGRRRRPWVASKDGVIINYFATKTEAVEQLNQLAGKPVSERIGMTFVEVYAAWYAEHTRNLSKSSMDGYTASYLKFTSLYNKRFRDLRTPDFQKAIDDMVDDGMSRSSTSKARLLLSLMSKWSIREEIITTNFAAFVKLQNESRQDKPTFSHEDIAKLEANAWREDAKIVLMLIYTGMRISELFDLPKSNVFEHYCIGGVKTEAGKNRVIPISERAQPYFDYFMQLAPNEPLLLDGYSGNCSTKNFRKRDYYPLLDTLGIDRKSPHSTRHTFASMAVAAGMKPEHLQKILGHVDYSTTADLYVHSNIAELVQAVNSVLV